ncbi:MAG: AI-2E family transporter [Paracoccaceae bacterium]
MGLSIRGQVRWWSGALVVFVLILWVLGDTLLPFVAGAALAYLLDPIADRLEAAGLSRVMATVTITVTAIVAIGLLLLLLLPLIIRQGEAVGVATPGFIAGLRDYLSEHFPSLFDEDSVLRNALASAEGTLKAKGADFLNSVLASTLALFDLLMLVVIAPVVAFYLLLDWDRMIAIIDGWLPRQHAPTVRTLAARIDKVLAGFVRGQFSVCAILGTFYAVGLAIVGLQFGVFIGLAAGILSFIPYVGALLGGIVSLTVAVFQFSGQPALIAAVAFIYVVGQLVEGNVLSPLLVGGSVGLHPVWLMFALTAFGSLFGFTGLLIAVPVSAAIGVLVRFGIEQYKQSALYRGPQGGNAED